MSLAGSFGDQAYVCKMCRQTTASYSPNCPACLKPTLVRIETAKKPPPAKITSKESDIKHGGSSAISYGIVAALLGLFVAVYFFFVLPAITGPPKPTAPAVAPAPVQPPKAQTRPKRPKVQKAVQPKKAPASSEVPAYTGPRTATPMRLWEKDD